MSVFASKDFFDHEEVVFINDSDSGLKAIIAIHNRTLGPALGGCRMWNYQSEEEALTDVLRLSRGMTYKAAIADVKLGGGKCVILGDNKTMKTPELMRAMGKAINRLNGSYITGPDIGTGVEDMTTIHEVSKYVIGVAEEEGGYGDPSTSTAMGVFVGTKAAAFHKWGSNDLTGIRVIVQGLGHVGWNLCRLLADAGAEILVSDLDTAKTQRAAAEFGAQVLEADKVYDAEADVFSPCAFGAVINDDTLARLKVEIISGGANNQLHRDHHGKELFEKGVIYLPDYVVNGGGLVQVAAEWFKEPESVYKPNIEKIYDTCLEILNRSQSEGIETNKAADLIAEDRIERTRSLTPAT